MTRVFVVEVFAGKRLLIAMAGDIAFDSVKAAQHYIDNHYSIGAPKDWTFKVRRVDYYDLETAKRVWG